MVMDKIESYQVDGIANILIVDDVPDNLSVLFDFLLKNNYQVLIAQDGESALEVLQIESVDLILLDVMMPGLDGFTVCQQLKNNAHTADIPIIFMTALSDVSDKVKGFASGAVDYVTKPIQQEEVLARIHTHLTLRQLQKKLAAQNEQLRETNIALEKKNRALAEKNAQLDAFSHTVAHDLKNPLGNIFGFVTLLENTIIKNSAAELREKQLEFLSYVELSGRKIQNIIESLMLLAQTSKLEDVEIEALDMDRIIHSARYVLMPLLEKTQAELHIASEWPTVYSYAPWIEQVWVNYLSNAVKYGAKPPVLYVGFDVYESEVKFWVRDNGNGLTEEQQKRLFTPFTRLHRKQAEGTGLGLCVVESILRRLGGRVGVESKWGQGSLFYFCLPKLSKTETLQLLAQWVMEQDK
jgi:two-component system, sensor histidine kinase and response regulator